MLQPSYGAHAMAAAFLARSSDDARAFAHPVPDASSALEAAILFAERWPLAGEAAITVTDGETGHEQCFRVDLADHTAAPC
jgi:hypothetical protein